MSDHCEEQEMEAEALAAIFDTAFVVVSTSQPFEWSVKLLPVDCGGDPDEEEAQNYVAIKLIAKIPLDYPELSLPDLDVEIIKGLTDDHRSSLLAMAQKEAKNNEGMPAIYAIAEVLREWLADNNQPGQDDASMHAQMMRKQKELVKQKEVLGAREAFESQKRHDELTEAETEEQEVRKRRAEGTPCTKENFEAWRERFNKEMEAKKDQDEANVVTDNGKKKKQQVEKKEDKTGRITGFLHFSGKTLEAIERAAEAAASKDLTEAERAELAINEDISDDDLDYDDDEDDDEDDYEDDDEDDDGEPEI